MTSRSLRKARWKAFMLPSACAMMSLAFASLSSGGQESDPMRSRIPVAAGMSEPTSEDRRRHLHPDDTMSDLLEHPAFAGFARLLLPWDDRAYDPTMRLANVGSLLPYHSHVNPAVVVRSLNRMIDDVNAGKAIFYDVYGEDEKRKQPAREHTGLFFFRGRPGAPFAVIAPGGGFAYVGSLHEGFPYAEEISRQGYNAFVLKYRTGHGGAVATEDLAAAISAIMRNADALGVSTSNYSLWGSSAGARMVAAVGSHGVSQSGGGNVPKPATVVTAYTGHSDYSPDDSPTYAIVGEHDGIAAPSTMERRVAALRKSGVEVAFRIFKDLGHGFGLGIGTSADGWIADAVRFWERSIGQRN
jgi:acetyl esterase/lipase